MGGIGWKGGKRRDGREGIGFSLPAPPALPALPAPPALLPFDYVVGLRSLSPQRKLQRGARKDRRDDPVSAFFAASALNPFSAILCLLRGRPGLGAKTAEIIQSRRSSRPLR